MSDLSDTTQLTEQQAIPTVMVGMQTSNPNNNRVFNVLEAREGTVTLQDRSGGVRFTEPIEKMLGYGYSFGWPNSPKPEDPEPAQVSEESSAPIDPEPAQDSASAPPASEPVETVADPVNTVDPEPRSEPEPHASQDDTGKESEDEAKKRTRRSPEEVLADLKASKSEAVAQACEGMCVKVSKIIADANERIAKIRENAEEKIEVLHDETARKIGEIGDKFDARIVEASRRVKPVAARKDEALDFLDTIRDLVRKTHPLASDEEADRLIETLIQSKIQPSVPPEVVGAEEEQHL